MKRSPPVADMLTTANDYDGRGEYVISLESDPSPNSAAWDEGGNEDWRGDCLVCPCTSAGVPVAWPEEEP